MFQQTHTAQNQDNKIAYKASPRYGQFFVKILLGNRLCVINNR